MRNLNSPKRSQQLYRGAAVTKLELRSSISHPISGFTLIELLVVVFMIAILAAIAAPGWLAFVSRQRVNKANDAVLEALQTAQQEAKKKKLSYSVSFRNQGQVPQVAIYPAQDSSGKYIDPTSLSSWNNLGGDLGIKQQVLVGTNFTTNSDHSYKPSPPSDNAPQTITFNYLGALDLTLDTKKQTDNLGTKGLIVAVAAPQPGDITKLSNLKRCVIVQTLIGGMRTAKDSDCN